MLKRFAETDKGIVYFDVAQGDKPYYRGYLALKTPSMGQFDICYRVFSKLTDCLEHIAQLKANLLNYDNDPQSYIRLFV
jgi:hypothetical protein